MQWIPSKLKKLKIRDCSEEEGDTKEEVVRSIETYVGFKAVQTLDTAVWKRKIKVPGYLKNNTSNIIVREKLVEEVMKH